MESSWVGVEPLFEQIQKEEVEYPEDLQLSPPLSSLLKSLFVKEPESRAKLLDLVEHEWVAEAKRQEEEAYRKLEEEQAAGQASN